MHTNNRLERIIDLALRHPEAFVETHPLHDPLYGRASYEDETPEDAARAERSYIDLAVRNALRFSETSIPPATEARLRELARTSTAETEIVRALIEGSKQIEA